MPTPEQLLKHYQDQGYSRVVIRNDEPNFSYPLHYHTYDLTFYVIAGEMTVTINHQPQLLKIDQEFTVPAGQMHTVDIGSHGCIFIHAEK